MTHTINLQEKFALFSDQWTPKIIGALHEGTHHSERPNLFDFSDTVFPRNNPD